jgi:hypothetical protein
MTNNQSQDNAQLIANNPFQAISQPILLPIEAINVKPVKNGKSGLRKQEKSDEKKKKFKQYGMYRKYF